MNQHDEIKTLAEMLFKQYGQVALNTEQTASVLDKSVISLKQDRANGVGIPYTKVGRLIRYSVTDIASHIVGNKMKVV